MASENEIGCIKRNNRVYASVKDLELWMLRSANDTNSPETKKHCHELADHFAYLGRP